MKKVAVFFIALVWPTVALAETPAETAEKAYNLAVEKADAERDKKVKAAKDKFVTVLKTEMEALTKKGDLDGALKVRDKINQFGEGQAPTIQTPTAVEKGTIDKKLIAYFYAEKNFGKGGLYDYSDDDCKKLFDDKFDPNGYSSLCVGWRSATPSPIVIHLPQRSALTALRIHAQVNGHDVGAPNLIQVFSGTKESRGELIGEVRPALRKTDWIEIPLSKPAQFLWVQMQKSQAEWVLVDEMDLK